VFPHDDGTIATAEIGNLRKAERQHREDWFIEKNSLSLGVLEGFLCLDSNNNKGCKRYAKSISSG